MIVAIIKSIDELIAIEPGSSADLQTGKGGFFSISWLTEADREKGRAIMQVEILNQGEVDSVENVFFLDSSI